MKARFNAMFDRIRVDQIRIDPRHRRLVTILASVGLVFFGLVLPVGMEVLAQSRKSDNQELRTALADVQEARGRLHERNEKKEQITQRYSKKTPPLAGLLDDKARAQKLEVSDSVDRQPVPVGKHYSERETVLHFKKAGMYSIAKFLESLEQSGFPVSVSRINIRKRSGEPDSFDVELGVSAYDKDDKPATADKSDKSDNSDKDKKQ